MIVTLVGYVYIAEVVLAVIVVAKTPPAERI